MPPFLWSFLVDGMPFDHDTLTQRSLGGSETAGLQLARAMAQRSHEVHLFCRCEREGTFGGVRFHHVDRWLEWATLVPHDVAVIQRIPQPLTAPIQAPVRLLWAHDLALKRSADAIRGSLWAVDRVLVLSQFMKHQYQEVYGLPEAAFHTTRNGIDLTLIDAVPVQPRDLKLLVYTGRPERGMDILLEETFPRLLQADPDLRLAIAGYDNYVEHLKPLYEHCNALIGRFAGRVRHLGALTKPALYQLYKQAALYIYSSDFEEISCVTAMEAMASGLPFIGSTLGALTETLHPEAGVLIPWEAGKGARDPAYQEAFVAACLQLLQDRAAWQAASEAGRRHAQTLGWEAVAEDWERLARRLLTPRRDERVSEEVSVGDVRVGV